MATRQLVIEALKSDVTTVSGRIARRVLNDVRQTTPRDTGYHASRWVAGIGKEPAPQETPNTRKGRAAALNFSQQAASILALGAYRIEQGAIFIVNDGNYIEELDKKHNITAPAIARANQIALTGTNLK
jgi:hypothetical protein